MERDESHNYDNSPDNQQPTDSGRRIRFPEHLSDY